MTVEYTVISIGTLSCNRLWGESSPVRTSHATSTLVIDGKRRILVDPSLPATALAARFFERTGRDLHSVTDVFCTTLRGVHRRSIEALCCSDWWANEPELEFARDSLREKLDSAGRLDAEEAGVVEADAKLLERFKPAPEKFTPQVHLYPMIGASAGSAGLLLTPPTLTIVVAGDAALTAEHVERGQVWEGCHDAKDALASLADMIELADVIVPGHDNVMLSPKRLI